MKNTTGKDFENRTRNRLEKADCHVLKIPDPAAGFIGGKANAALKSLAWGILRRGGMKENQISSLLGTSRFANKNPYDFQVTRPIATRFNPRLLEGASLVYALECKTCAGKRFPFSMVLDHQRDGLDAFPFAAGFVVELREVRRCFFLPIDRYKAATRGPKKSLNVADFELVAIELPYNSNKRETLDYYDVGPLLAHRRPR